METKQGLKPGMKVRNRVSGNVSELVNDAPWHPEDIFDCADEYVYISRRQSSGRLRREMWLLKNIELV